MDCTWLSATTLLSAINTVIALCKSQIKHRALKQHRHFLLSVYTQKKDRNVFDLRFVQGKLECIYCYSVVSRNEFAWELQITLESRNTKVGSVMVILFWTTVHSYDLSECCFASSEDLVSVSCLAALIFILFYIQNDAVQKSRIGIRCVNINTKCH